MIVCCRVRNFVERRKGLTDIDNSLASDLTEVENYLLRNQELMVIRGKVW